MAQVRRNQGITWLKRGAAGFRDGTTPNGNADEVAQFLAVCS
jgi:hypothetical protein